MRSVFVCPCCGHGFRRAVVPAGALADARAEVQLLREQLAELERRLAQRPGSA